jgi:hypothetical protein
MTFGQTMPYSKKKNLSELQCVILSEAQDLLDELLASNNKKLI